MPIDDSVFAPVAARTNLYRDEAHDTWRIRIPDRANIALDTLVTHARGPRRDHPALVFEDEDGSVRRYSFADLDALSDRLAKGLHTLGTKPGDPVAVHTGQRPETAVAHLAIHKLGAVVMTLSQLYGPDTVEHCLADSGTRIAITDRQAWNRVRDARSRFTELEHVLMVGAPAAGEQGPAANTVQAVQGKPIEIEELPHACRSCAVAGNTTSPTIARLLIGHTGDRWIFFFFSAFLP